MALSWGRERGLTVDALGAGFVLCREHGTVCYVVRLVQWFVCLDHAARFFDHATWRRFACFDRSGLSGASDARGCAFKQQRITGLGAADSRDLHGASLRNADLAAGPGAVDIDGGAEPGCCNRFRGARRHCDAE
jgi:hypothetical protein